MRVTIKLEVTTGELEALVRLVGHHTCGEGMDNVYEQLYKLCPKAEGKGPFEKPLHTFYPDRPMVSISKEVCK
jgi:hypothetical protein